MSIYCSGFAVRLSSSFVKLLALNYVHFLMGLLINMKFGHVDKKFVVHNVLNLASIFSPPRVRPSLKMKLGNF